MGNKNNPGHLTNIFTVVSGWLKNALNGKGYSKEVYESHYANGQLKVKGTKNSNGEFEGAVELYYENGQLEVKGTKNSRGYFEGAYETDYPNGLRLSDNAVICQAQVTGPGGPTR